MITLPKGSFMIRGVAQLVARTAGGREVAGSSPVTPTTQKSSVLPELFCVDEC